MPSWSYPPEAGGGGGGGGGATACEIDVAEFPGIDLGAKLQAAIDSLPPEGGVLTCECLTGAQTISSTVTVDKPVKIIFGECLITVTAGPGIDVAWLDGSGSILQGAGPDTTIFQAAGGVTPIIRITGYDVSICDIGMVYTSGDASNVQIQVQPSGVNPDNNVLRPHLSNLILTGAGAPRLGSGITFQRCYVGSIYGCFALEHANGVRFLDDGDGISSNAIAISGGSRFWHNNYGLLYENTGANAIDQCTIEGNLIYGIRLTKGLMISVTNTYFEQINLDGALGNVLIDGISDTFSRKYDFSGCVFLTDVPGGGKDITLTAGALQAINVNGGQLNSGVTIGAGQPAAFITAENFGTNSGKFTSLTTTDTVVLWSGVSTLILQIQNYQSVDFYQKANLRVTSTETLAVSVSAIESELTINPGANSAANAFGARFVATTFLANAQDFTGSLIGLQAGVTHNGTGTITLAESLNLQFTNLSTGIITTGVGLLIAPPVNSGLGTIGSFTAIQIQTPLVASSNRSFVTDGGLSIFNDGNTTSGSVNFKGDATNNLMWVNADDNVVGVGLNPSASNGQFTTQRSTTETTGTRVSCEVINLSAPAGASTASIYGAFVTSATAAGNGETHSFVGGVFSSAEHRGTNTLTTIRSMTASVTKSGTGNITASQSVRAEFIQSAAGTTSEAYGLVAAAPSVSAGTLSVWYSLFIDQPTAAGQNYSVYHAGGFMAWNVNQSSVSDFWILGQTITEGFYFDVSAAYLGLGTMTPATKLHMVESFALSGATADGYAACVTQEPTYTGNFTLTRHNYQDIKDVVSGTGAPTITDACVWRFNANPGTHKAVDGATTKTTPGGVDAWIKQNINGTVYYVPAYLSKTA